MAGAIFRIAVLAVVILFVEASRAASCANQTEMALIGPSLCIDRWESAVEVMATDAAATAGNRNDTVAWTVNPYYLPLDGLENGTFRAASTLGRSFPQAYISADQATAACQTAGKRLCTLDEWESACGGPGMPAYPYGPDFEEGYCNVGRESPVVVRWRLRFPVERFAFVAGVCVAGPMDRYWVRMIVGCRGVSPVTPTLRIRARTRSASSDPTPPTRGPSLTTHAWTSCRTRSRRRATLRDASRRRACLTWRATSTSTWTTFGRPPAIPLLRCLLASRVVCVFRVCDCGVGCFWGLGVG